ncbi:MAG: hypothetical protein ACFFDH_05370 [Promethearchaeota archaeon]
MKKGYTEQQILEKKVQVYHAFRDIDDNLTIKLTKTIFEECRKSNLIFVSESFAKKVYEINKANVSIGNHNVSCRGAEIFFTTN